MSKMRMTAAIVAALVAGLVVGNVVSGFAAPTPATAETSATQAAGPLAGMGLRMGAAMREAGGRMADVLAKLTGLSTDEIHDRRVAGESVADIAKSEGVEPGKVVSETLAVRKSLLDGLVADGRITADQADAALDTMESRLNERMDSADFGRGMGRRGGGMGGRGGGPGAGGCSGTCTATASQ